MALGQFLRTASAALGFPLAPPDSAAHMLDPPFSRASRPEGHLPGLLPPLWPGQAPHQTHGCPQKARPLLPLAPPYLMTSRLGAVGLTGDQCDGAGAVALALPRGKTPTDLDVTTEKWEDKRPGRPVCRITKSCPGLAGGQWREGSERLCPGDLAGPISPLLDCLHRSTHSLSGAP